MDIISCGISGEGVQHLGEALTSNHSLTELDISENTIGDTGAAAFREALTNNATVTMDCCGILSGGCVALAAGLTHNTALLVLWLSGNCVGVEGAVALAGAIIRH